MTREMTVGYENRQGRGHGGSGVGWFYKDLPARPMLRIANDFLRKAGFNIGSKIAVQYEIKRIVITPKDNN